jgi:hypothetical protein
MMLVVALAFRCSELQKLIGRFQVYFILLALGLVGAILALVKAGEIS